MKTYTLSGTIRTELGKKTKTLRETQRIPATIYGKKKESISVSIAQSDFLSVYKEAGETSVISFLIDGVSHPVLVHAVQRDPVSERVLHVELYQVDMKEKVKTKVPVALVGEAPALVEKKGALLSLANELEVEALPANLPDHLDVDISSLREVGDEVLVSSISVPEGVTILTEGTVSVVKVDALVSKAAQEQEAQEQQAQAEAAAPAAGEGEAVQAEQKPQEAAKETPAE